MKLSKAAKAAIQEWIRLRKGRDLACPFLKWTVSGIPDNNKYCCHCAKWFPRICKKYEDSRHKRWSEILFHPCEMYSERWVVRRARQMLRGEKP